MKHSKVSTLDLDRARQKVMREREPNRQGKPADMCQYFLLCRNQAEVTVKMPFGDVPMCPKCKAKYDSMS